MVLQLSFTFRNVVVRIYYQLFVSLIMKYTSILLIYILVNICYESRAQTCNPMGVYEVTLEYSLKNWKQNLKSLFLVMGVDEKGEQIEIYNIVIDTNKSVSFEKNKLYTESHNRVFPEIIFVGKCKHSFTPTGIVKHTDIHSQNFNYHKISQKTQLHDLYYTCPLDVFYYGNNYRGGYNKVLPNSNNPVMPLSFSDNFKEGAYNVKRTVSKVQWSDRYLNDFNNLVDLLYDKSKLQIHNAIEKYTKAAWQQYYIYVDNHILKDNKDNQLAIGGINRKLFFDKATRELHSSIDSIFINLTKGRYDSLSIRYYDPTLNNIVLPYDKCSLVDSILNGGYVGGTLGILVDILSAEESFDISSVKSKIDIVEQSIQRTKDEYQRKIHERDNSQSELETAKSELQELSILIKELRDIQSNLLMKYRNKTVVIDTNREIDISNIDSLYYFINSSGSMINPFNHKNISDILLGNIKDILQFKTDNIANITFSSFLDNEVAYDDLGKLKIKINYLENLLSRAEKYKINNEVNLVRGDIELIKAIITNSTKHIKSFRVETDRELERLLLPRTSNMGRIFLNAMISSYQGGRFRLDSEENRSWSRGFIDSIPVKIRPLLISNGLRYINPSLLNDSLFVDNTFLYLISPLLDNITRDSTVKLFERTRFYEMNNLIDKDILSFYKYGLSANISNHFTSLNKSILRCIDTLSKFTSKFDEKISVLTKSKSQISYSTERDFVESLEEFKLSPKSGSGINSQLISIDSLVSTIQRRGKVLSMSDLDSLYAIHNVKDKTASQYIYLKTLEYGRDLSNQEQKDIWENIVSDPKNGITVPDLDSIFTYYNNRDKNKIYGLENPVDYFIWSNGGMHSNLSFTQRRDIWRTVISRNDAEHLLRNILLDKFYRSNGPLNVDQRQLISVAPKRLVTYLLKNNVLLDKYCINAIRLLKVSSESENRVLLQKDSINRVAKYNELLKDIIINKSIYETKYPLNPVNLRNDSIQLHILTEKLTNLKVILRFLEKQRSESFFDPIIIQSNIPMVIDTNIYTVFEEYKSSRGTSSIWNTNSTNLKKHIISNYMKKKLQKVWSSWRNVSYDIHTGEWVLLSTMDLYNDWPPPGNACDQCCARMGFTLKGNKLTVTSFYVFSDCY